MQRIRNLVRYEFAAQKFPNLITVVSGAHTISLSYIHPTKKIPSHAESTTLFQHHLTARYQVFISYPIPTMQPSGEEGSVANETAGLLAHVVTAAACCKLKNIDVAGCVYKYDE